MAPHCDTMDGPVVKAAREYVHTMLGFVLYSRHLYTSIKAAGEHEE